jgi:branched-chain amino acid transport system substrate-binding protein
MLASVGLIRGVNPHYPWDLPSYRQYPGTPNVNRRLLRATFFSLLALVIAGIPVMAQKKYDTGATDTEIKIGSVMSYTGWAKEYGAMGRAEAAYFQMINDRGGINGRKINFISVDNGSAFDTSGELTRKLVEDDGVLLIFGSIGTQANLAVRPYLNDKKIPQLFLQSSSAQFDDPAHFPWTMGFFASYHTEGVNYARYILQNKPDAKIAVLYANNEDGNEYVQGLHDGLGAKAASLIVKEESYRISEGTVDAQIEALKNSGANVFMNFSVGSFATKAIRKAYDLDWHPLQFIPNASLSVAAFLDPAGLEKSKGIITNARSKGWLSPSAKDDPAVREFLEWMNKYNSQASLRDQNNVSGYLRAQVLVEVLRKCGDDLTRANVMKQASNLDLELGMLRPGIRVKTTPTDYQPIKQLYLMRFNGHEWEALGSLIGD